MIPVYVIHLPDPQRRRHIEDQLVALGYCAARFVYVTPPAQGFQMNNMRRNPRAEFGCALSHLEAIDQAREDDCDRALFIEDDVVFTPGADKALAAILEHLRPPGYRLLYLGGHPRGPVENTDFKGLYRVKGGFSCAEAYVMPRWAMDAFPSFWRNRIGQSNAMYDFILGEFATLSGGYACYPTLTHQLPGWSHIGQKNDDKTNLIERGWRNNLFTR